MLNEVKRSDLFCEYYARWITVYKQGAIRKVTMISLHFHSHFFFRLTGAHQLVVPVFFFGVVDPDASISVFGEESCQPLSCFHAGIVVVETQDNLSELRILLQHPEHGSA